MLLATKASSFKEIKNIRGITIICDLDANKNTKMANNSLFPVKQEKLSSR